ncbi:Terpenoid cyclases/Protein prenyltransferases superfamily protein [Euphorbia peplus]|nr:Terpenoid cyclases/Protein prenyltransferases superfamily protein [Euphorbia peplus]
MAVPTPTIPAFKFGLNQAFWVKGLPHKIRLPNTLHYNRSQKLNKTRANVADVQSPREPEQDMNIQKNYKLSFWGDTFISLAPHDSELESNSKKVEAMKVKVKDMLIHSTNNIIDNVEFINLLCRLGVSYHFEDEINEQLNYIFTILPKLLEDNDYELHTLANLFRISRQYGYKMSSDVFKKFRDIDGEFKKDIANDVKGLLSLYEACFLATHGEHILDDALNFTRKHLEILAENSSPPLHDYIMKSLMYPSHRTIERLDAFNNICFYEEDEFVDETLIKFAKLDYNGLQLLYRKELALLSRWRADLKFAENFPYSRDRLVESYIIAVGYNFEPQYSKSRELICKYLVALTPLDDAHDDSYATIDEMRLFGAAIERFTIDAADELPEYMKHLYKLFSEVWEIKDDPQGCACKAIYANELMKNHEKASRQEGIWLRERKAPSFDEYVRVGKVITGVDVLTAGFILGVEQMGMKEILWLKNEAEILSGAKLHVCFQNDINGLREENAIRGEFPKAVDCYMIEHEVSQAEAIEAIQKILENEWKKMNEGLLKPTNVPRILLKHTFNHARIADVFCKTSDLFTNYGNVIEPIVKSLILDPLSM